MTTVESPVTDIADVLDDVGDVGEVVVDCQVCGDVLYSVRDDPAQHDVTVASNVVRSAHGHRLRTGHSTVDVTVSPRPIVEPIDVSIVVDGGCE